MVGYKLRRVDILALPLLIRLSQTIWLPTFTALFGATEAHALYDYMHKREKVEAALSNPESYFFILENESQKPSGYCAYSLKGECMSIDKIYVDLALQGQGIGGWIMDHFYQAANGKGMKMMQLNVNRRNAGAIRFYERCGFNIAESVDIPGPGKYIFDDYIMVKEV